MDESFQAQVESSSALAKAIGKAVKKAIKGSRVRQGYVGSGAQAARRQLFVRLNDYYCIDLWIGPKAVHVGGVHQGHKGSILRAGVLPNEGHSDAEVVALLVGALQRIVSDGWVEAA